MTDDPRTEPLKEWNRLARENTENAIVSSMFEALLKASEPIEQFSIWLLIGTAAIASFFIANSDKIIHLLSNTGFLMCGAFLCLSCISGLVSKMYALGCRISIEVGAVVRKTFSEHLKNYKKEEEEIQRGAKFWGISLESGIRMERVLAEFYSPQPKIVVWLANRRLKKYKGNPQVGYILNVNILRKQGIFAGFQALLFLAFLVAGFIYAATL